MTSGSPSQYKRPNLESSRNCCPRCITWCKRRRYTEAVQRNHITRRQKERTAIALWLVDFIKANNAKTNKRDRPHNRSFRFRSCAYDHSGKIRRIFVSWPKKARFQPSSYRSSWVCFNDSRLCRIKQAYKTSGGKTLEANGRRTSKLV